MLFKLLVLHLTGISRRLVLPVCLTLLIVLLVGCGADAVEQAEVIAVAPTSVPTTAPLSVPTPTATPTPLPTPVPAPTALPVAPAATATEVPTPQPTTEPAPTETTAPAVDSESAEPAATAVPEPTAAPEPTTAPEPTAAAEPTAVPEPTAPPEPTPTAEEVAEPTALPTSTTVVVASGEPPLECYDPQVKVYRAFVDGVDALSFDGGRVTCVGAGTNAVSAAASYRHSTGLIVQRNANYIFRDDGNGYIPFSGALHFCVDGQAARAPVQADTVPSLLIVIEAEAQRQVALGVSAPANFTDAGSQC